MTVMVVGISAIVAGLSSGYFAVKRAGDASTAAAVADKQMEAYRALPNCAIYLDSISTDSAYVNQTGVYSHNQIVASTTPTPPLRHCAAPSGTTTTAHQQIQGGDGRLYWVDTYIVESTLVSPSTTPPVPTGTVARKVTVIVRDPKDSTNTKQLVRETEMFAPPTGCTNPADQQPAGC
jgi:hypothetical protein